MSFVRPHLDYGDILYDQTFNNSFYEKLASIQYNVALAITGAKRKEVVLEKNFIKNLGFESLQQQRWYRKLCLFFKIMKKQSPKYLFVLMLAARQVYMTRQKNSIPLVNVKHNYFNPNLGVGVCRGGE